MSSRGGSISKRTREGAGSAPIPVTVVAQRYRDALDARVGRPLTDAEIANLVGAQPGMRVEVGAGAMISAHGPRGFMNSATVVGGTPPLLYLNDYRNDARGTRLPISAKILRAQVVQTRALGLGAIHTKSRQHSRDFVELPRLGFDTTWEHARVEAPDATLPARFGSPRLLSDLLAMPGGSRW